MNIKDLVVDKVKSFFLGKVGIQTGSANQKKVYIEAFKKILEDLGVHRSIVDSFAQQYSANLENIDLEKKGKEGEKVALNLMWFTVYMFFDVYLSDLNLKAKKIAVIGMNSTGKSSFICSLLKKQIKENTIHLYTQNAESFLLIQGEADQKQIIKYSDLKDYRQGDVVIWETGEREDVLEIIGQSKAKILLCIDSQSTYNTLVDILRTVKEQKVYDKIAGIIITKRDFIGSVATIFHCASLFKKQIVAATENEIRSSSRNIVSGKALMSNIGSKLLDNNKDHAQSIKEMFDTNQICALDLNTYKMYLNFMIQIDENKFDKLLKTMDTMGEKLNIGIKDSYKETIKKMKSEAYKNAIFTKIKKQAHVIDSMKKGERRNPDLINFKRAKRIADGSGTRINDVFELLESYKQYRKTMEQINYSNSIK